MKALITKYALTSGIKAVEGETLEVDRLPVNPGEKVGLERVLMLVDDEEITVGTPTVGGIQVNTTVMDHFKGPKLIVFKYSPKKRIRVKGGHRQQYTRLMVDVIGKPGETREAPKAEKVEVPALEEAQAKAEKKIEKKELKEELLVTPEIRVENFGALERTTFKAKRISDKRPKAG
jgi:large subunit ribosomal protein L21